MPYHRARSVLAVARSTAGKKIGGGAHPIGGASGGGQWDGAARWQSTAVERVRWSPMGPSSAPRGERE
jgi:hypothetical protein